MTLYLSRQFCFLNIMKLYKGSNNLPNKKKEKLKEKLKEKTVTCD